jgi:hypothetical protein
LELILQLIPRLIHQMELKEGLQVLELILQLIHQKRQVGLAWQLQLEQLVLLMCWLLRYYVLVLHVNHHVHDYLHLHVHDLHEQVLSMQWLK